jgi:hypothetical protein
LEKVKAHYDGQKMLSKILFFEIVWLSTSTKPIKKEVLVEYIQNKVVRVLDNAIFKINYIFWLILNDVEKTVC